MNNWTPQGAVGQALLSLHVQGLEVAVHADTVREILGERPWVALPGARDEVPGVVVWAGRALAVLDLARFHPGLRALAPGEVRSRLLLLETVAGALALPADRVSEVYRVHEDSLRDRELHQFELARAEVVGERSVVPLFDPALLLERLGVGG